MINNATNNTKIINPAPAIKPAWKNLLLRAQSVTRNHDGVVFLQLQIVVKDGIPLFWAEPKVVKIEPKLDISLNMLLQHVDEEGMKNLLNAFMK